MSAQKVDVSGTAEDSSAVLTSKRLEILKKSLARKQALFDMRLSDHFSTVSQSNGQPLNDKSGGAATMRRWDKQNDALRALDESIEVTKRAIEREESAIANTLLVDLPLCIQSRLASGVLRQWRKHPETFFVVGVDKARLHINERGLVTHRYVSAITDKAQYAIFRDVFNSIRAEQLAEMTGEAKS